MTYFSAFVAYKTSALGIHMFCGQAIVANSLVIHELVRTYFWNMTIFLTAKTEDERVVFEVTGIVLDIFAEVWDIDKGVFGFLFFRVVSIDYGCIVNLEILSVFLKKLIDLG